MATMPNAFAFASNFTDLLARVDMITTGACTMMEGKASVRGNGTGTDAMTPDEPQPMEVATLEMTLMGSPMWTPEDTLASSMEERVRPTPAPMSSVTLIPN